MDRESGADLDPGRWLHRYLAAHAGDPSVEGLRNWAVDVPELTANGELLEQVVNEFQAWELVEDVFPESSGGSGLFGPTGWFGPTGGPAQDLEHDEISRRLTLEAGQRVGPFEIRRFIAKGGMGQVWEAEDTQLRRRVALKLVLPERVDARALAFFAREARAGGRLQHPNIVMTLAHGSDAGLTWIAQELVEGSWTLKDFLDELRSSATTPESYYRSVAELIAKLADALQAAHTAGVIHRDVKPANVLVTASGQPKLTDFGLARVLDESLLTQTGEVAGSWPYMSPEQVTAGRLTLDHRTDIFSLGVVLYELLTLRRPFEGDTSHQIAEQIVAYDPPAASEVRSQCPKELSVICGKALEKAQGNRYSTAADLADDLRRHVRGEPILARPPSAWARAVKGARRHPVITSASLVGLIALIIVSALAVRNARLAERNRLQAEQMEKREKRALRAEADADLQRARAEEERRDVLRLSALQDVQDLRSQQSTLWPAQPSRLEGLRQWQMDAQSLVADLPLHHDLRGRLESLGEQEGPALASSTSPVERRWWYEQVTKLISGLEALESELLAPDAVTEAEGWSVTRRIAFAERLKRDFAEGGAADVAWERWLPAMRESHPRLAELTPQLGLIPLGPDPDSGLFEFAHLASGKPATRDSEGRLVIEPSTGVVLVLLVGGEFVMGSQSDSPTGRNHDQDGSPDEGPPRTVGLSPFFLSKYEMNQAQWLRATGERPSYQDPGARLNSTPAKPGLNPVEQVSWIQCDTVLRRLDLVLPTEAQWEYGCRGGSSSPRWFSVDEFPECANVKDRSYTERFTDIVGAEPWTDGYSYPAPVNSMRANPFGLHHTLGNVWEWCQDAYDPDVHDVGPETDPVTNGDSESSRIGRGGSFNAPRFDARASDRGVLVPTGLMNSLGVRPARALMTEAPSNSR